MHSSPTRSTCILLVACLVGLPAACDGQLGSRHREPAAEVGGSQSSEVIADPCLARNPIAILDVKIERDTGKPETDTHAFQLPIHVGVCFRVESVQVAGHRITAGEVALDGDEVLGPDDFKQFFEGTERRFALCAGQHYVRVRVESKPGTFLRLRVLVPGPVVDTMAPITGPTGTTISFTGEVSSSL